MNHHTLRFKNLLMRTPFVKSTRNGLYTSDHGMTLANYANYYKQFTPLLDMRDSLRNAFSYWV